MVALKSDAAAERVLKIRLSARFLGLFEFRLLQRVCGSLYLLLSKQEPLPVAGLTCKVTKLTVPVGRLALICKSVGITFSASNGPKMVGLG